MKINLCEQFILLGVFVDSDLILVFTWECEMFEVHNISYTNFYCPTISIMHSEYFRQSKVTNKLIGFRFSLLFTRS